MVAVRRWANRVLLRLGYRVNRVGDSVLHDLGMRQIAYFARRLEQVADVPGDVVECGVGNGWSLLMLASLVAAEGRDRHLFALDSFRGFPDPAPEDVSPRRRSPRRGEWSGTRPVDVRRLLVSYGINEGFVASRVTLVPGFFAETLPTLPDRPIALLHIDADLYQSYLDVLVALAPRVSRGGVIMFDEYGSPRWPGATKAVDEYFGVRAAEIRYDAAGGKHYLVIPR